MELRPAAAELIGQSPVFLDALAHASDVAEVDRPVLILGERGTQFAFCQSSSTRSQQAQ